MLAHGMTRLRQLRLARGWTMERMLAQAGGVVTKSALSKYELGEDRPSAQVATRLSAALNVKVMELLSEPLIEVRFTGYRRAPHLTRSDCERIEAMVNVKMERRLHAAQLLGQDSLPFTPHGVAVKSGDDVEMAAEKLRKHWKLGTDPIVKPIACLESRGVHVIEHNGPDGFTGLSGTASTPGGKVLAVVVVCRTDQAGERQGLTALHEAGHVYTQPDSSLTDKQVEYLMYRFAGAFHAPADAMRRCFGDRRTDVGLSELLAWKKVLRLSIAALVYRLADLEIISDPLKRRLYGAINGHGWAKEEPEQCPSESPTWMRTAALRLLSEGAIGHAEAERMMGEKIKGEALSLRQSREFLKLPVETRRRLMQQASKRSAQWYAGAVDRGDFEVADSD